MKTYRPEELIGIDLDNINRRILEHCVLFIFYERNGWPHEQKTVADVVNLRMRAYTAYKESPEFATKVNTLRAALMQIIRQEIS